MLNTIVPFFLMWRCRREVYASNFRYIPFSSRSFFPSSQRIASVIIVGGIPPVFVLRLSCIVGASILSTSTQLRLIVSGLMKHIGCCWFLSAHHFDAFTLHQSCNMAQTIALYFLSSKSSVICSVNAYKVDNRMMLRIFKCYLYRNVAIFIGCNCVSYKYFFCSVKLSGSAISYLFKVILRSQIRFCVLKQSR